MKISFSVHDQNQLVTHGYGQATYQMVRSLQRLGHTVTHEDPTAQVEMNFSQPFLWRWFSPDSYKIGMAAWESTTIPGNWKAGLRTCDELWTPSQLIAKWFADEGYPARVYEHGVDGSVWSPRLRKAKIDRPIKLLHIGEPAPRKGGQLVYDTFRELYGNSQEVSLTIKGYSQSTVRGRHGSHPFKELNNVKVNTEEMSEEELVMFVKMHDILIYPSYGEGFGLIPLQAMATGMPVVCTEAWAPYSNLLIPELKVNASLAPSPWDFHTGDLWHPDHTDLAESMQYAVENFPAVAQRAYDLARFVTKRYDWDRLTQQAFAHIVEKFES